MPVRTIFLDCDQTLINKKGELFPGVAVILKELKDYGYNLICWSRSGHRHVRRMLDKHDLLQYFKFNSPIEFACLDKPDVVVDDTENPIRGAQHIHIEKPEDWERFYDLFYGKPVV